MTEDERKPRGNADRGRQRRRRVTPLVDVTMIRELALRYVGRYATTRQKLVRYLTTKIRESAASNGLDHDQIEPLRAAVSTIADDFVARGYIDDAGWARARSDALDRRGYGARRIHAALRGAGIDTDVIDAAIAGENDPDADISGDPAITAGKAEAAARRFAKRHKIGPFGDTPPDPAKFRRDVARMLRAGHPYEITYKIVGNTEPDVDMS